MALSAELNLFTFGAQRRQATGVGLYLITEVLLNISSGGLCVRVKDERVVVQQQPGALLACEASPHSERGMRKVLTFAGGGRPRETAVPLRIDLELQSDADAALLQVRSGGNALRTAERSPAEASLARSGVRSTFAMRFSSSRRAAWAPWRAAPWRAA